MTQAAQTGDFTSCGSTSSRPGITVIGEERTDIASELTATSDGVDEAEAQALVKEVKLVLDAAADTVAATIRFPDPGTQRATLVLRVPSRLRVRVEPNNGRLEIQHVASAEVMNSRGETVVKNIADRLSIIHRGGDLTIEDVGSLRLETRGSDIKLAKVRGDANLRLQAGDLRAEAIAGPLEIDSNDCDVMLEKLGDIKGVMRVNAVSGQISIRDLRIRSAHRRPRRRDRRARSIGRPPCPSTTATSRSS